MSTRTKTKKRRTKPAPRTVRKMREIPPPEDRYLGELALKIVGTQYCDVSVRPGEVVHFEREPGNRHDANAIRVDNDDFAPVGHVPRREARWIAPLLDSGRLKIDGRIPPGAAVGQFDAPLLLKLYLTPKGESALRPFDRCAGEAEALHEVVLGAYERSAGWTSRAQIIGVGRALAQALGRDALPESFLVIRLFQIRARALAERQRRASREKVRDAVEALRVGKGCHYGGLTLFPLFGDDAPEPDYLLLGDALDAGLAEVTEISDEGSVVDLQVISRADRSILIPAGEIVCGGKQNRVVNVTMLVEAHGELLVPVSCVEEGRWGDRGERFRVTHFAAPGLRSVKTETVLESIRSGGGARSDQGEVWARVGDLLDGLGALSDTASYTAGYDRAAGRLDAYRRELPLEEGARGFLATWGGDVLGAEIFDAPSTLAALWPRLSESYFLEAVLRGGKARKTLRRTASAFLRDLAAAATPEEVRGGGNGQLAVETPTHVGAGLLRGGRILHLGAFLRGDRRGDGAPGDDGKIDPGPERIY